MVYFVSKMLTYAETRYTDFERIALALRMASKKEMTHWPIFPMAFENQKLNGVEQRYNTHKKEMIVVIHCLKQWRHYLFGSIFTVAIGNVAKTFFTSHNKLSAK